MFTLGTVILTGLIGLAIGCVVGALLMRTMNPEQQQNRELEQRLEDAENKLNTYQQEVTEHFAQTSQLVNNLTHSYKEVHEHLAQSALNLSNPEVSRQIIEAADGKLLTTAANTIDNNEFQQPRDWAPKSPGSKGALSEDYGLEDEKNTIESATVEKLNP